MPALLVSLCYLLVLHQTHAFVSRSPIISTPSQGLVSSAASASTSTDTDALKIIFSDIDGSLIHYPKQHDKTQQDDNNKILELPPSATGLRGIISSQTLATCRDLRVKKGVKLVLVTGARTSTLLNRLPYLPKADAYCTEAGGRIFYPVDIDSNDEELFQSQLTYTPLEYSGAIADDLKPFGLREDRKWRERMELG
jgi:hydroxymethylpyrimidine pyrophosphatase-like HAD family hydrolase